MQPKSKKRKDLDFCHMNRLDSCCCTIILALYNLGLAPCDCWLFRPPRTTWNDVDSKTKRNCETLLPTIFRLVLCNFFTSLLQLYHRWRMCVALTGSNIENLWTFSFAPLSSDGSFWYPVIPRLSSIIHSERLLVSRIANSHKKSMVSFHKAHVHLA